MKVTIRTGATKFAKTVRSELPAVENVVTLDRLKQAVRFTLQGSVLDVFSGVACNVAVLHGETVRLLQFFDLIAIILITDNYINCLDGFGVAMKLCDYSRAR